MNSAERKVNEANVFSLESSSPSFRFAGYEQVDNDGREKGASTTVLSSYWLYSVLFVVMAEKATTATILDDSPLSGEHNQEADFNAAQYLKGVSARSNGGRSGGYR